MATPIPKNAAPFSIAEIVLATRGEIIKSGELRVTGVSTDTRSVSSGELFVALKGDKFDAHDHVRAAVERGASAVLVSRAVDAPADTTVIRVRDTLGALGDLAAAHRARWAHRGYSSNRRIVAITGSAGKTTTRHAVGRALAALVGSENAVHTSRGNLNNAIGVPMTLFGLEAAHRYAVVEIGMNQPGEIRRGAEVVRPDAAAVTLVADAHTEGVGSIWGVLREKSEVFSYLGGGAVAVANADDEMARASLVHAGGARRILYGSSPDADVRLVGRRALGLGGSALSIEVRYGSAPVLEIEATVPLLGRAGVYASLASVALAIGLGVERARDGAALASALASLGDNEAGRLAARERSDGTVVIDDAYNANPASMKASIEAAREIASSLGRPLVLVLGSMFELGPRSEELHEDVGRAAADAKPRAVVAVGALATALARGAESSGAHVVVAADASAAESVVAGIIAAGDVVLVKASNSLGLHRVAAQLLAQS
ncbi:MAG: UDP-N-acetylmuramoyl-tripeptide--D-alanyl-D-alanine ligase [Polyangiaceae bacterium]|nr:UDP-N-acetylmuramoyl-tripeptide--D-alanyl-D-alanine ligase [Polyangiaceae bacterium]